MLRLLVYLVLISALASAIAWFSGQSGGVVIEWSGWQVETSATVLLLAFAATLALGLLIQRAWTWVARDFLFSSEQRARRREKRGLDALNRALVALAAGDRRESRRLTRQAVALLPPQPLTHILAAESARLAGDTETAATHYRALADSSQTAFLGLRGLIEEARGAGNDAEALRLAEEAAALRPDSEWALRMLFSLQVARGLWEAAARTLDRAAKKKLFAPDRLRRHQGALAYCRGVEAEAAGDRDGARRLARESLAKRPGFVPAAVLAGRILRDADKIKEAAAVLTEAWAEQPHPDLAALYRSLHPNERPSEWYRRVKTLAAARPDHWLSLLLRAEAAVAAEHLADARFLLGRLKDVRTERVGRLRELVEGRARAAPSRSGLPAALQDEAAGAWICSACRAERRKWVPTCPGCRRFDSLDWREARGHTTRLAGPQRDTTRLITAGRSGMAPPPDSEPAG